MTTEIETAARQLLSVTSSDHWAQDKGWVNKKGERVVACYCGRSWPCPVAEARKALLAALEGDE